MATQMDKGMWMASLLSRQINGRTLMLSSRDRAISALKTTTTTRCGAAPRVSCMNLSRMLSSSDAMRFDAWNRYGSSCCSGKGNILAARAPRSLQFHRFFSESNESKDEVIPIVTKDQVKKGLANNEYIVIDVR